MAIPLKQKNADACKRFNSFFTRGGVFGHTDGKNYVLAKRFQQKYLPDSFKCRHILIGTNDPQSGQPIMPDSTAHKLADSVAAAIKNGANFDSLEAKFSTDKEAHKDKGVMTLTLRPYREKILQKNLVIFY